MISHRSRSALGGAALVLGIVIQSASTGLGQGPATTLPDELYPRMLKYSLKGIQDCLKGGSPKDDTQAVKARTAALMIAAYAQQNLTGNDGQQRATVRDAALKVADLIKGKKYAEALKEAAALESLKPDAAAKKEKVKIVGPHLTYHDLMNQFNHPPDGGWGIDRQLYKFQLGMKGVPLQEMTDTFMNMTYQVAVVGELAADHTPKFREKDFTKFAGDLREGGLELAAAAKDKNSTRAIEAIAKVTTTCTNCHKVFKGK